MDTWVIGIDCSTSAVKALVWDRYGQMVAEGRATLTVESPRPSWHEQDAEAWWAAAVSALRAALRGLDARKVAALSITHQRETFVAVDERGQALRKAILWMDERARTCLPELQTRVGSARFHEITGKPLTGNLTFSKLAWLRQNEAEVFEHAAAFLDTHAYLVERLTGERCTAWGSADPTGLLDMRACEWSVELLDLLGVKIGQMPRLCPPGKEMGRVTAQAAQASGLPVGLPVIAGIGDGQAGGLGVGVTAPGAATLSLGTSVISASFSGEYCTSPAFRSMTGGIPGSYLLETVILGGTYTLDWFMRTWGGERSQAEWEAEAALLAPGAEGLLLLPYWNSAMNPYWDASASGLVMGWRGVHRPAHLYRAILEGIAFEQALQLEGVENALGRPVQRLTAMGGGAQSNLWLRIIADVSGKPVFRAATREAAALGAGILAAVGAGWYASAAEAVSAMIQPRGFATEPDGGRRAFYRQIYEDVYRPLFPAVRPMMDRLTSLCEAGAG